MPTSVKTWQRQYFFYIMKNILSSIETPEILLEKYAIKNEVYNVNAHIHTPFSFSAFNNIKDLFKMASNENVKVLGINDFYVTDGYAEFHDLAVKNKIFPLFNIEVISLLKEEQKQGLKINDPNNPGRTYMSGKGLRFPAKFTGECATLLKSVIAESTKQVVMMIDKINDILQNIDAGFSLSFEGIKEQFAKELVRERHIAKALQVAMNEKFDNETDKKVFLKKLYSNTDTGVNIADNSALENELRGKLLKAGGAAFVPEKPSAFMETADAIKVILNGGGIPTYPLLLDDKNGNFTDFEKGKEAFLEKIKKLGVCSVEFIPNRNNLAILKEYTEFLWTNGIIITFGTEHNAPNMIPITVDTRGNVPLDDSLKEISYKGSCVVAAHQYLVANKKEGYVNTEGVAKHSELEKFIKLGNAVINRIVS